MQFDTRPLIARAYVPVLPNFQNDFGEMENFDSSDFEITEYNDLLTQFYVDRKELINNIDEFRKMHPYQFTLGELLKAYPIKKGMAEIAVYYDLIHTEPGFVVDEATKEQIQYEVDGALIKVTVPKLIIQGNNDGRF